jgi:hypothetical protein
MHVLVKATGYHVTAGDVMLAEIIWENRTWSIPCFAR